LVVSGAWIGGFFYCEKLAKEFPMTTTSFRFSVHQFRSLPAPTGPSRVGFFYARAADVPAGLLDWREVNPREINRRSRVYKAITDTLLNYPKHFHERNRGISIIAKELQFDEKHKQLTLAMDSRKIHGVVDGAHTLDAVIASQKDSDEEDRSAFVFLKVIVDADPDQIAEIAGGLNTSEQVDLKSLENLRGHFTQLERVLSKETYANKIAFKMFEDKPVDVRELLYYLAVFDCSEYSDKSHPVALFGRKEGIVRRFAEQMDPKKQQADAVGDSFKVLISKAPEILRLRDSIEKAALAEDVGRYKAGKGTRIRSASARENELVFLDEKVDGKIPLGWIMPMLAAFRANVAWNKPKGSFSWIVPVDELLASCIGELLSVIKDVHSSENSRPEYVGRNSLAWRMSYSIVTNAILNWRLNRAGHSGPLLSRSR